MGSAAAGISHQRMRKNLKIFDGKSGVTEKEKNASDRLPLTPTDFVDKKTANISPSDKKLSIASNKSIKKKGKFYKLLKILLPHIGLNILLMLYMAGGAYLLMCIEYDHDLLKRREKLDNVTLIRDLIIQEIDFYCIKHKYDVAQNPPIDESNAVVVRRGVSGENARNATFSDAVDTSTFFREKIKNLINQLSVVHEYDERFSDEDQMWTLDRGRVRSRWTFQAALLYSLTLLCTTGYDHVSPVTDFGRIFAVGFGLLGIPLMFIAAADIGKFLSEMVTKLYAKLLICTEYVNKRIKARKSSNCGILADNGQVDKKQSLGKGSLNDEFLFDVKSPTTETRLELPILAYFGLVLGYCAIGGLLFNSFEKGAVWSFIHGFFFSFNTITTIGLGNVMVNNNFYLLLIVIYCIVGLAVITMCVDLASAHLKMLFTKLHYFGRKFRGARNTFLLAMSDDIKEALRLIAALKKSRPGHKMGRITLDDIKTFLESELQQQSPNKPFVPSFIDYMKYVDEDEKSTSRTPQISGKISRGSDTKKFVKTPSMDRRAVTANGSYM